LPSGNKTVQVTVMSVAKIYMDNLILEQDGCCVNAETVPGRFPVEPLNTVSNIVFLVLLIYWLKKVGFKYSRYPLIAIVLPVMFLGLITATIHHSLRIDKAWKTITVLSIFYSVVMTCVYFWYRVSERWLSAFFLTMLFPLLFWMFYLNVELVEKINLSIIYTAMSIAVFIPGVLFCIKDKLKNLKLLALSSFLFTIGMVCRMSDLALQPFFSYGTHFLWHIFGAASVFVLLRYIYLTDEQRAEEIGANAILRKKKRKDLSSLFRSEKDKEDGEDI